MTTTEIDVDTLIERLEAADAAMGSWRDIANTDREQVIYWQRKREIFLHVEGLRNAANNLEKPQRLLADCEARRAATVAKREEIEAEVGAFVDLATIADIFVRAKEESRQRDVRRRLQLLDDGRLYAAPDVTYERVADLDLRIAELRSRIDLVRSRFEAHVKGAEQLLATVST